MLDAKDVFRVDGMVAVVTGGATGESHCSADMIDR